MTATMFFVFDFSSSLSSLFLLIKVKYARNTPVNTNKEKRIHLVLMGSSERDKRNKATASKSHVRELMDLLFIIIGYFKYLNKKNIYCIQAVYESEHSALPTIYNAITEA